jgi:hypothetical protein
MLTQYDDQLHILFHSSLGNSSMPFIKASDSVNIANLSLDYVICMTQLCCCYHIYMSYKVAYFALST